MRVLLDDHLLRDWLARRDSALVEAVGDDQPGTTNLWYVRLCKSAAKAGRGALLRGWSDGERRALVAGLVALPPRVAIVPMRTIAWHIGELVIEHHGLSTLSGEALAAAHVTEGRILASARDESPGLRAACRVLGVSYATLPR